MQVVVDDTQVVLNKGDVSVTLQDNHQVWVDDHNLAVVKCPDFTLDDLRSQIESLISSMSNVAIDYQVFKASVDALLLDMSGTLQVGLSYQSLYTAFSTILNEALATVNGNVANINNWITQEISRLEINTNTQVSSYASLVDIAVAELGGNIAASYSTNQALAEVVDGVTHLRAEAATFATVTMANGQKAISGWKAVADTNEPSAMYVYADTFYVVSPVNGEIRTLYPLSFIGEFSIHPLASSYAENSVYKNTIDGNSYVLKNGIWELFLSNGADGTAGIAGTNGVDGITNYTWIKYASDANGTGITDFPDGMPYLGVAYNKTSATESTNPADYTWSLIQGSDGIAGTNGVDGITTYTWIKYADTYLGVGMSDSPTGKLYIGIAVNKTTATESTTAADYTWSLIKGEDGATGATGPTGSQGATGATGSRGAGMFQGAASAWSDVTANSVLSNLGLTKVLMDKVTLSSGTFSATKYWSGSSWIDALMYVDGNLVVQGTILANRIVANDLAVVTSYQLDGTSTGISVFPDLLTTSNSNVLGSSFIVSNASSVPMKTLFLITGRTAIQGPINTSTKNFGLFVGSTMVREYGHSPSEQDALSLGAYYTIPANTSLTFSMRVSKTSTSITQQWSMQVSVYGMKN